MPKLYQTKDQYRCTWLKIYHHNINRGAFKDKEEAKYYTVDEDKFSIIGLINDNYKIDDKFEFLIEFPNLTSNSGMNRWAQTYNPLSINEASNTNVIGFEPVTLSWPEATDSANVKYTFCGLARSNIDNTLLDGTCGKDKWFFSIGITKEHGGKFIPGFTDYNKETILWLRVERRMKRELMMLPKLVTVFGLYTE